MIQLYVPWFEPMTFASLAYLYFLYENILYTKRRMFYMQNGINAKLVCFLIKSLKKNGTYNLNKNKNITKGLSPHQD